MYRAFHRALRPRQFAILICSVTLGSPVFGEPESDNDSPSGSLQEIVVTAQRREQRLQDTPLSVTALTGDALRDLGAKDITRAGDFAPNVRLTAGPQGSGASFVAAPFIRGIGQQDYVITTDPGVGIYVDDVYYARTVGAAMNMLDVDRIEILRGPQGTLFGKNAIGGAINVVSAQPDGTLHGTGELSYGRFNEYGFRGDLNLPLSDTVDSRIALVTRKSDGFGKRFDLTTGNEIGRQGVDNDKAVRARVRWTPDSKFSGTFSADYQRVREPAVVNDVIAINPNAGLAALYNALLGSPKGQPYTAEYLTNNPYASYSTGPNVANLDHWGTAATLTWDLGPATVKSITSYRHIKAAYGRDADGSPLPILDQIVDLTQHQVSQELQLFGKSFDNRLTWLGGLFYFNENAREKDNVHVVSGIYPVLESLPAAVIPLGPGITCPSPNAQAPCAGGAGNPLNLIFDNDFFGDQTQRTNSYAVFGQATAQLTPQWSLTAGGRYTRDQKNHTVFYEKTQSGLILVPAGFYQSGSWSAFTPKLGVEFKPAQDLLLYATGSRGFRGGGFNGRPTTGPEGTAPFNPEYLNSYEIGVKSEWLDHRLRANVSAFYNDYSDLQVTVARIIAGQILNGLQNAAAATIKGAEFELQARPVSPLQLSVSFGYLDAYYRSLSPDVTGFTVSSKLQSAPKITASAAARYEVSLSRSLDAFVHADYSYRSEVFNDAANTPHLRQGGYGLLSARLGLQTPDREWEADVYGTNLTDKVVIVGGVGALNSLGFDEAVRGRPREYGVSLTYRFGAN